MLTFCQSLPAEDLNLDGAIKYIRRKIRAALNKVHQALKCLRGKVSARNKERPTEEKKGPAETEEKPAEEAVEDRSESPKNDEGLAEGDSSQLDIASAPARTWDDEELAEWSALHAPLPIASSAPDLDRN
jgi:DNA mismatch repair ATPase MutL